MSRVLWVTCLLLTSCSAELLGNLVNEASSEVGTASSEDGSQSLDYNNNILGAADYDETGGDETICKYACGDVTKKLLRDAGQCAMRCARHAGAYSQMSDEDFHAKLRAGTDMCRIDDSCIIEPQARELLYTCLKQEAELTGRSAEKQDKAQLHGHRVKRGIQEGATMWDVGTNITYSFDATYTTEERAVIQSAIDVYRANTCLQFELTTADVHDGIHFLKGAECTSFIGNIGAPQGDPQPVTLASGCLNEASSPGTPLHEILHALGFVHEQVRPDRDEYVTINFDNIQDGGAEVNFLIVNTTKKTPFDISSVMLYAKTNFANAAGVFTLTTNNPDFMGVPGQRRQLSFFDLQELNLCYCETTCPGGPDGNCLNGGYQNPADCNSCICPPTHDSQPDCGTITPNVAPECTGPPIRTLTADSPTTTINMEPYMNEFVCAWQVNIEGVDGSNIKVNAQGDFNTFSFNGDCIYQWMEIYDANKAFEIVPRYCRLWAPENVVMATNSIIIVLKSAFVPPAATGNFILDISLDPLPETSTAAATDAPATTAEAPATTAEAPATTAEAPVTTAEAPATTAEAPATTAEAPATTAEAPATTAEAPATTAETTTGTETRVSISLSDGIASAAFRDFWQDLVETSSDTFCSGEQESSCCPSGSQFDESVANIVIARFPDNDLAVFRTQVFASCMSEGGATMVEIPASDVVSYLNNNAITLALAVCCTNRVTTDCCAAAVSAVAIGPVGGVIAPTTPAGITTETIGAILGGLGIVALIVITCLCILCRPRRNLFVKQTVTPLFPPGPYRPPLLPQFGRPVDPYRSPIYSTPDYAAPLPVMRPALRSPYNAFSPYY